jgi:hypothetical protein
LPGGSRGLGDVYKRQDHDYAVLFVLDYDLTDNDKC